MRFRSRKKYRDLFLDRSLKNNLVLAEGIGVCPLIGGATTLKTGVAMFVCAVFTLVLTSLFMRGIGKHLDIKNCQGRIGDSLAEHGLGVGLERRLQLLSGAVGGDEGELDAHALHGHGKEVIGTSVNG